MDEKTIQRIKKLQALAERGVGGEKTTAQKKLAKLLKDNGINSLDELQKEEYEYTIFSYNGKHEIKLLRQCMYKVMGAKSDRTAYKPYGRRQKIGIYCTKAQKIEIELEFEFYRNVFYEELSTFMDAFIQAQKIFPEDAPVVICRCRFTTPFTYKKGKGRKYDKEKAGFFTGFRYCNHGRAYRWRYQGKCSGTGRNAYTD